MLTCREPAVEFEYASEGCWISSWRVAIEADGRRLEGAAAAVQVVARDPLTLRLTFADPSLVWTLRSCRRGEATVIESRLENTSPAPIALGKAFLLDSRGAVQPGQGHDTVCLPLSGELGPREVRRLTDGDCPRSSKIKLQLYDPTAGLALQVGFVTFQRANTEVEHEVDAQGRLVRLCAWCDFAGWRLDGGQTTALETFLVAAGPDPYRQLEAWADLAAEHCRPRCWEDVPIGWVGWAWVDPLTVERYEDVVMRNCRAIRRRLAGYGVHYVWVSIGNLRDGVPGDWLAWNWDLFPSGPERLAQNLRELGFRWGLWCGPFWICTAQQDQVERLQEAFLRDDAGQPMVVRGEWQFGQAGWLPKEQRPRILALDPSHPQTLELLRRAFSGYRAWGVRYYMLDFLHAGAGSISSYPYRRHHDQSLVAGPEVYHRALQAIRQAAGDDTYFLSSSGPSVHNAGIVDAARTGSDFGEGRPLYPDSYFYPATYVTSGGGYWTGPLPALKNQAAAYYTHRKLYLNDSGNVLTVDKPLSVEAARVHATVHALSGGPTMLGDDIDRIDPERLALVTKTLPRPRPVAFPLDLFEAPFPDHPKLFHRRIDRPWGRYDVLAVYNFGAGTLRRDIPLTRLGLGEADRVLVWEFWNEEYRGRSRGSLTVEVPPGAVRVYRLVVDTGRPVLLGTDMHLTMGEMEIDGCTWDDGTGTLSGAARRPEGEQGSIFLHAPAGLRVADPRGLWIAKDARDESLLVRLSLTFGANRCGWAVRFTAEAAGRTLQQQDPA